MWDWLTDFRAFEVVATVLLILIVFHLADISHNVGLGKRKY